VYVRIAVPRGYPVVEGLKIQRQLICAATAFKDGIRHIRKNIFKIPLASLAAILLMTGYKLAKISLFKTMFQKGWPQFIPFIATILAIVFTDLLIGVLIGLAISIFYLLRSNYENPFTQTTERTSAGKVIKFELSEEVSFLNKAAIKSTLWRLPKYSKVVIDATYSKYIDPDVLEMLDDYQTTFAPENDITLSIRGLPLKN
jgi:carbonic anhydrase